MTGKLVYRVVYIFAQQFSNAFEVFQIIENFEF